MSAFKLENGPIYDIKLMVKIAIIADSILYFILFRITKDNLFI